MGERLGRRIKRTNSPGRGLTNTAEGGNKDWGKNGKQVGGKKNWKT